MRDIIELFLISTAEDATSLKDVSVTNSKVDTGKSRKYSGVSRYR
jgi:hypothetical protein